VNAKLSSLGVLVVFYANVFNQKLESMKKAGGETSKLVFEFPEGRRFNFCD
jgi:hypothetical protein